MPKLHTQEEHSADAELQSEGRQAAGGGAGLARGGAGKPRSPLMLDVKAVRRETEERNLKLDTWESSWEQLSPWGLSPRPSDQPQGTVPQSS